MLILLYRWLLKDLYVLQNAFYVLQKGLQELSLPQNHGFSLGLVLSVPTCADPVPSPPLLLLVICS